ncbi:hypothetical protein GGR52DRAFT_534410 [Hypoxylon sp. FL1284]|nr:hypothetical protein GGR52DRAFT_534410 [Hypoxylon sp. FL1284]
MACDSRPGLLTLPLEIRQEIYRNIIPRLGETNYPSCCSFGSSKRNAGLQFAQLLRVCAPMHDKVASLRYGNVECSIDKTKAKYLRALGRRYCAFIRQLYLHWVTLLQSPADCHLFFRTLSYSAVQPEKVTLRVSEIGFFPGWRLEAPLFKHLTVCLGRVRTLEIFGEVDPIWGFFLRKRFGFIWKRHRVSGLRTSVHWEFISPRHFDPTQHLKNFSLSTSIEGIYEEHGYLTPRILDLHLLEHSGGYRRMLRARA